MFENERIVCEFLRKIAPSREWEYLGEVEHYWIGELCDELNKQLKAENAKLRELVKHLYEYRQLYFKTGIYPTDHGVTEHRMRELGVEVD